MILLTLASLAIVLLVVAIYNKLKDENISLISISDESDNKDAIIEGLTTAELDAIANKEHQMLDKRAGYYDIRDDGAYAGLLTVKPGASNWIEEDNLKDKKTKKIIRGGSNQPLKKFNEVKPKISLDASKTDNKVVDCNSLESCDDLTGDTCGYCLSTNTFSYGSKKGSKVDACPDMNGIKAWSMDAGTCKKQKARATC